MSKESLTTSTKRAIQSYAEARQESDKSLTHDDTYNDPTFSHIYQPSKAKSNACKEKKTTPAVSQLIITKARFKGQIMKTVGHNVKT